MEYIFDNDRPIYVQLLEKLELRIVSGEFKPGDRLPSVRELALTEKVNPNTMQKTLSELEDIGLIYTERTNGKFVTEDENLIKKIKKEMAEKTVKKYLQDMKNIGINYEEATKYLQEIGGNN